MVLQPAHRLRLVTDFELTGRRALVTGAGQGVGAAVAEELAALGVAVVVNDLHAERAEAVAARITDAGGTATAAGFDVTDAVAVNAAIAEVGAVDILVNNAGNAGADGFGALDRFVDTSPDDWSPFLAVNLHGVMHCTHAVLPAMIEAEWGRIITIVSDSARTGGPRMVVYGAAKAAAAAFGRGLAHEVARHHITVNNLALGTMRTELTEGLWADPTLADQQDKILSDYLIRRPGAPDDVAWMVATLASPRADWITGQTIPVNGGFSFAQ